MRKVRVIEEYSAQNLEEQINYMLDHEELIVTNIQYQTTSITSSRQPEVFGEASFGGSVKHSALIEYKVHEKG